MEPGFLDHVKRDLIFIYLSTSLSEVSPRPVLISISMSFHPTPTSFHFTNLKNTFPLSSDLTLPKYIDAQTRISFHVSM